MIRAKHHPLVFGFFKIFARLKMKSHFERMHIVGQFPQDDASVLLIANHTGWWDGFWALILSTQYFKRKYYFMMLEKELAKRWLFAHSGGFSIAHKAKSMVESLNYAADLLKQKNNLILMFPQAKMHSLYRSSFSFGSGVARITKQMPSTTHIYFLASLIDYFDHPKPTLYLYVEAYKGLEQDAKALELAYNEFIEKRIEQHKKMEF